MAKKRSSGRAARAQRGDLAIEDRQKAVAVKVAPFEKFFREICREVGLKYPPAAVCFVTDGEMKRLNTAYRKKRKTTDVLSFPSEERPKPKTLKGAAGALRGKFLGDIAISPTVARRNAKQFGRTMTEEVRMLLLHGILHLMGYDHESDRGEMEREESMLRRRLGLTP
jgi:probable rRNA maturation factor